MEAKSLIFFIALFEKEIKKGLPIYFNFNNILIKFPSIYFTCYNIIWIIDFLFKI